MLNEFITQDYLIVENNIVVNLTVWNGDTTQWTPPQGSIALVQATTPAMTWVLNKDLNTYTLQQVIGAGAIGFTWDGSVLNTNLPQPPDPQPQPVATGMQTIG